MFARDGSCARIIDLEDCGARDRRPRPFIPRIPMIPSLHRLLLRPAMAACAVLLAAACAPSPPPVAPAPQVEVETQLEPAAWTAQSSAAEIAAWARRGCSRAAEGKDACIERALIGLVEGAGIARSMEVLDTLVGMDPEVASNAHPLAHGLGIAAYRSPETVAGTFAACPASQMSGCAHGVIQGYFLDLVRQGRSIGTVELDALCAPHAATEFLWFQCAHGMGHGLMAVHGNHLPMALQACDLATEGFVRGNCYGGAFMENVINFTHPHHTAGGHAATQDGAHADPGQHAAGGHDAHAAHGDAGAGQAMGHGAWKALDPADPLYPCNAVAPRYQYACYGMQPSAVMFFNGGDVAATARACEGARGGSSAPAWGAWAATSRRTPRATTGVPWRCASAPATRPADRAVCGAHWAPWPPW
jgi:hypothetical protein